ncbi:hypothetical protein ACP70R_025831 [Stipagrostis hirtigluma subsp. patula]
MAGHRALLLLVLAAALLAALAAVATAADDAAKDSKPSILTPIAQTPLGSFDGDKPGDDDALDDEDAAPVGSPTGATPTEPKPPLTTPPGGGAATGEAEGATSRASTLGAAAARVGAVVAVAAGAFAF